MDCACFRKKAKEEVQINKEIGHYEQVVGVRRISEVETRHKELTTDNSWPPTR